MDVLPDRRGDRRSASGERLAELAAMATSAARVRIFSDDGDCVADPLLMRRALEYVKSFGGVIAQHAQDPRLTEGAQMHEGEVSARLGMTGWPAVAEEAIIARDCLLADHVGSRLHVCHLSTAGSVELVAAAKARGTSVTAEVTPHHLLLTDERASRVRPGLQGQPAPAHGRRRGGGPRGARRRSDRHRGDRSRPTCQPGQGNRVGPRQSRHARPADRAVGGDRHHGAARSSRLARRRPGHVRGARPDRRASRSRPADRRGGAGEPDARRPRCDVDGPGRGARVAQSRTRRSRGWSCPAGWSPRCCAGGSPLAADVGARVGAGA